MYEVDNHHVIHHVWKACPKSTSYPFALDQTEIEISKDWSGHGWKVVWYNSWTNSDIPATLLIMVLPLHHFAIYVNIGVTGSLPPSPALPLVLLSSWENRDQHFPLFPPHTIQMYMVRLGMPILVYPIDLLLLLEYKMLCHAVLHLDWVTHEHRPIQVRHVDFFQLWKSRIQNFGLSQVSIWKDSDSLFVGDMWGRCYFHNQIAERVTK